jgi:hypothetical protein
MKLKLLSTKRKDGKFKISLSFPGSPNAFGGFYYDTLFTKLKTVEQIEELIANPACEHNITPEDLK